MRGTPDSISISLQQTPIPTLWEKKEVRSELRPALPLFSRPNDPFHQNTPHVNLGPLTLFADPGSYCLCLVPDDPESSLHLAVIWSFGGLLSLTPGPRLLWRDEIEVGRLTLKRAESQISVIGLPLVSQRVLAISTRVGNSSKENKISG